MAAVLVVPAIGIAYRSYRREVAVFFPERRPFALERSQSGLNGVVEIEFRASGNAFSGWYVPSANRAAVVLLHGAGGDRASLLFEAQALARRGFGVLTFDSAGHGNSEGRIGWSKLEVSSVGAALDWLVQQKDLDPARLGALGFSLGGYVLAQAAASDMRIKAIVLAGTPSDPVAQVRWDHRQWSWLGQLPALWALRRGGMDLDVRALDMMGKLAPRPVLVIGGAQDQLVPVAMAHELYAAAAEPKELHIIEGAGHTDFAAVSPRAYEQRVAGFFEKNLL
jgi:fermentation-respiration switch protein FrsA (DUF1100 family)